tara:strand:- start:1136 stop:1678 length:543 start_codon:yes stop_codon:yes gene_type:complete
MKVKEFKQINTTYPHDAQYKAWWSRQYEYPTVLKEIARLKKDPLIHNTCWGFEDAHVMFKNDLEELYGVSSVVNSDAKKSSYPNTCVWNMCAPPPTKWEEAFDIVLNISTLEHLPSKEQTIAFYNLMELVKPGGHLICTFDLPGLDLLKFEGILGSTYQEDSTNVLTNGRLTCGLLVIQK